MRNEIGMTGDVFPVKQDDKRTRFRVNGKLYGVRPEKLDVFLKAFPEATRVMDDPDSPPEWKPKASPITNDESRITGEDAGSGIVGQRAPTRADASPGREASPGVTRIRPGGSLDGTGNRTQDGVGDGLSPTPAEMFGEAVRRYTGERGKIVPGSASYTGALPDFAEDFIKRREPGEGMETSYRPLDNPFAGNSHKRSKRERDVRDFLANSEEGRAMAEAYNKEFRDVEEAVTGQEKALDESLKTGGKDDKFNSWYDEGTRVFGLYGQRHDAFVRNQEAVIGQAREYLKEARRLTEAVNDKEGGRNALSQFFRHAGRDIGDTALDSGTLGLSELAGIFGREIVVLPVIEKFEANARRREAGEKEIPFSRAEQSLLEAMVTAQHAAATLQGRLSVAQGVAEGVMGSIPYMTSFATGNWLTKGLTKAGQRYLEERIVGQIGKKFSRAAAKGIGETGLAATRAAAISAVNPRLYAEAVEGTLGDATYKERPDGWLEYTGQEGRKSFGSALGHAFLTNSIENLSEMSGGAFSKIADVAGLGRLLSRFRGNGKFSRGAREFMKAAGWNGLPEEFFEEQLATVGHSLANDGEAEWKDLVDGRQQLITLLTISAIGSVPGSIGASGDAVNGYRVRQGFKKAEKDAREQFGDEFEELDKMIGQGSIGERAVMLHGLLEDEELTPEQKAAASAYYARKLQQEARAGVKQEESERAAGAAREVAASVVNPTTGRVTMVRVQGEKDPVRLARGNVALDENGVVVPSSSDEVVYLEMNDGRIVPVDPREIEGVTEDVPAGDVERAAEESARAAAAARHANEEARPVAVGETVTISKDGSGLRGEVTAMNEDGSFTVVDEATGTEVTAFPADVVEEENLAGVENGSEVIYEDEAGNRVTGVVEDAHSRRAGQEVVIDGKIVPVQKVVGLKSITNDELRITGTGAQGGSLAPSGDVGMEPTPSGAGSGITLPPPVVPGGDAVMDEEDDARRAEREAFYAGLPRDKKGNVDEGEMDAATRLLYAGYELGDAAEVAAYAADQLEAARAEVKKLEGKKGKSIAERKRLEGLRVEAGVYSKFLESITNDESRVTGEGSAPLSEEQAIRLIELMEANAEDAPQLELTPENWESEFGEDGVVSTPVGDVKMGDNQYRKIIQNKREGQFRMIRPTLTNPDVVIEVPSAAMDGNTERPSSYLFVKTFTINGEKVKFFTSVTVSKEGLEVVISNHMIEPNQLGGFLKNGKLLWNRFGFDSDTSGKDQALSSSTTQGPNGGMPGSNAQSNSLADGKGSEDNSTKQGKERKKRPRKLSERQSRLRNIRREELDTRGKVLYDIASGVKFVWGDKISGGGARTMAGVNSSLFGGGSHEAQRRAMWQLLRSPERGGVYPEEYAHALFENDGVDAMEGLNEVLDVLRSVSSSRQALEELEGRANVKEDEYRGELDERESYEEETRDEAGEAINELSSLENEEDLLSLREGALSVGVPESELDNARSALDFIYLIEQYSDENRGTTQGLGTGDAGPVNTGRDSGVPSTNGEEIPEGDLPGSTAEDAGGDKRPGREGGDRGSDRDRDTRSLGLTSAQQAEVDRLTALYDRRVAEAEAALAGLKREYEAKKKEVGRRQAEETQGSLFEDDRRDEGLFGEEGKSDFSRGNLTTIFEELGQRVRAAERALSVLKSSRDGVIESYRWVARAQGEMPTRADASPGREASPGVTRIRPGGSLDGTGETAEAGTGGEGRSTGDARAEIAEAEKQVDTHPTEGQKEAGNYKKGHVRVQGFDISIEQPKGSTRSGVDENGKAWESKMNHTYGYIRGTEGRDHDQVDVFIGDNPASDKVFVVDQVNPGTGAFDEHKVMIGFDTVEEAREAYLSNYEKGWKGLGGITGTTIDEFREWVEMEGRRIKPFAEYKGVREGEKQVNAREDAPTGKIEDFGKKIGGARKDLAKEYGRSLSEVTGDDIRVKPLSQLFPNFNYKLLVESGALSRDNAVFLYNLREGIPTKPRERRAVARWALIVQDAISTARSVLENNDKVNYLEQFKEKVSERRGHTWYKNNQPYDVSREERLFLDRNYLRMELSRALGFPESGLKLGNADVDFSVSGNDNKFIVSVNKKRVSLGSFEEVVEYLKRELGEPVRRETVFHVYRDRRGAKFFVGRPVQGKDPVRLSEYFREAREAWDYLRDSRDEIQAKWDSMNINPEERRVENRDRQGADWRDGKDVSPEMFAEEFGFRGTEFGNWVNQSERQEALNRTYDALMDLSAALGISPRTLSLNGELAIAFGARGTGNAGGITAAAHYEPNRVVINLTKKHGAGSLAHEWWHAVDNYFSRAGGNSAGYLTSGSASAGAGVRQEMKDAFDDVMRVIKESGLPGRSKALDSKRSKDYWSTPHEMSARAFENYVVEKLAQRGDVNDYLANFKEFVEWIYSGDFEEDTYPYPTKEESHGINEKFQQLFDAVEERADEETGNVALFQFVNEEARRGKGRFRSISRRGLDGLVRVLERTGLANGVVVDREAYRKEWDAQRARQEFTGKNGEVYGLVTGDGTIYLNPDMMNANTPVHEFGHLWNDFVKRNNRELWEKGKALVMESRYWQEVNDNPAYAGLTEDERVDEAMAMAIGDAGERMYWKGNLPAMARFRAWLGELWDWVRGRAGIRDLNAGQVEGMTLEEFAERATRELLGGGQLRITNDELRENSSRFRKNQEESGRIDNARAQFIDEQGAANLDRAEEASTRMDNLRVSREMEAAFEEKKGRVEKLRASEPVEISGSEITPDGDLKVYKANALEYGKTLRGEYTNKDSGEKITVSAQGLKEVLRHDGGDIAHIQSVAAIPRIIENSIYVDTVENEDLDKHPKVKEYQYFISGLRINGIDYTVKSVIAVDNNGNRYYDHALTQIEKGKLLDELDRITSPSSQKGVLFNYKDKRLLSILQVNEEENARRIKMATGWERGADGKWRYEEGDNQDDGRQAPITDSGALEGPAGTLGDRASRATDVLPRTAGPVNESGDEGTGIRENSKEGGENSSPPPPGNGGVRFQAVGNEEENPETTRAREELTAKLNGRGRLGRIANKIREGYQDGLIAVKRFEELLREKGVEIPDSDDFYLQATAVPGKIDAGLAAYRKRFHEPLMAAIGALEKAGFSRREVENYAMLKHGIERNAYMAAEDEKAGKKRRQDYSGVSAIEKEVGVSATGFVEGFEERAGKELVDEFWKRARAATGNATRAYYRGGLMSREQLQALGDRYAYFIPLRGHDDVTAEDVYDYGRDAGEWFVNPLATAKGRSSRAATPFAYIEGMNATAIRAAERNLHRQAFLRMAGRDKTGLTTVSRQWYVKIPDGNGNVTWEARWPEYSEDAGVYARNISDFEENMARLKATGEATTRDGKLDVGGLFVKPKQAKHHAVPVMVNGQERVVYVNGDPRVAEAATGMNVAQTGDVMAAAKDVSRFMSANFTTRNPMFVASNFSRDTFLAMSMSFLKEGGGYTAAFTRNLPKAWGEMKRYLSGEGSAVVAEFIANGGKTGYSRLLEVRDLARRMEREAAGGGRWDENKVTRFLGAVNDWAENVNRVAVYMTSREAGRSVARSISDAKEITVNFNRAGSGHAGARYMNALYLFSNVAIQALDNFAGAARKNPGRATGLLLAYGAWGFLTPVLIQLLGGDDDLEEYLGLPEWDRKNNWCISVGSGVIKIPLPQELRVFHGVGAGVFSCVTGKGDWEREFYLTLGGLIDLAPYNVSNLSTSWAEVLPDAARPVGQALANRTFTGSPVYNEHADGHLPGYKQARVNRRGEAYTDDWLIEFAGAIDAMTGGDGTRRGAVSPNPDVLNQLGKGYLGGLFETAAFAFEVARKTGGVLAGEGFSLGVRETPGRRFFSDYGDNAAGGSGLQGDFFRARERAEEAAYLLKGYAGDRAAGKISMEKWQEYKREFSAAAGMRRAVDAVVQAEGMIKRLPRERQKEMEERVAGAKRKIVEEMNRVNNKEE